MDVFVDHPDGTESLFEFPEGFPEKDMPAAIETALAPPESDMPVFDSTIETGIVTPFVKAATDRGLDGNYNMLITDYLKFVEGMESTAIFDKRKLEGTARDQEEGANRAIGRFQIEAPSAKTSARRIANKNSDAPEWVHKLIKAKDEDATREVLKGLSRDQQAQLALADMFSVKGTDDIMARYFGGEQGALFELWSTAHKKTDITDDNFTNGQIQMNSLFGEEANIHIVGGEGDDTSLSELPSPEDAEKFTELFKMQPELVEQLNVEQQQFSELLKAGKISEAAQSQPTLMRLLGEGMFGAGVIKNVGRGGLRLIEGGGKTTPPDPPILEVYKGGALTAKEKAEILKRRDDLNKTAEIIERALKEADRNKVKDALKLIDGGKD